MNRNALGLGHAHELPGLGIAPGLDGTAVAELGAVPLFLTYDHDRLGIPFLAATTDDDRTGNDHAGIQTVLVLSADFGEVVIDVFQNVLETDSLGMPDNTHLVHGRDGRIQTGFHILEEIFQTHQFFIGLFQAVMSSLVCKFVKFLLQQSHTVSMFSCKYILNIGKPVGKALYSF